MSENKIVKSREKSKIKIGDEFGRLKVLENKGIIKGTVHFLCECTCGTIKLIRGNSLQSNNTKSCGCLQKEVLLLSNTKHGMCGTSTYNSWSSMIARCSNPKINNYQRYGDRGIRVCPEWFNFKQFFLDMGERPENTSIERVNVNGNYEPSNCIWASRTAQARNRRLLKVNTTGVNGVTWSKRNRKYCVKIGVNYKQHYIGLFENLNDAKAARFAAEQKYWT